METLLIVTGLAAGIAVFLFLLSNLRDRIEAEKGSSGHRDRADLPAQGRRGKKDSPASQEYHRTCPLCGAELSFEERVHSDITPPGTGDRIMRIYGCPHCWPAGPGKLDRICPVCKMVLPPEGYAVARFFEQPGRKHIHVLGCSNCRKC